MPSPKKAKARNVAHHEALTVRDSSLSACTQAAIAAEVGHLELAYDYFAEAVLIDLDNLEHNTRHGLHTRRWRASGSPPSPDSTGCATATAPSASHPTSQRD